MSNKQEIIKRIAQYKVIPVIALDDADKAAPLADALYHAGLSCAEVTFRTKAACESIRIMHDKYPDMLICAGTVLTIEQVKEAVQAGAQFIVSPGFNHKVVKYCNDNDICVIPGCCTPSDIEDALDYDLKVVKFFPAETSGGVKMLKALSGPFKQISFMPTGGISINNLKDYLSCSNVIACGGSWMAKKEYLENNDFKKIEELAKEAVHIAEEVK